MALPGRSPEDEDRYVAGLAEGADPAALTDAIEDALADRRPLLAARVVGLLDDGVEAEPGSPIARARAAAALLLFKGRDATSEDVNAFEDAYREAHRERVARMLIRQRNVARDKSGTRIGRLDGRGRRRR